MKFAKVMFLHLSVSHSVHSWGFASVHAGIHPPSLQEQTPPRSSACWEIRTTSGRYASYWNAYLLEILPTRCRSMFSFAVECALIRVPMSGCTASTRFNFGHRCEYALDGNYGTDWATNAQGIGSWIKVFVQR